MSVVLMLGCQTRIPVLALADQVGHRTLGQLSYLLYFSLGNLGWDVASIAGAILLAVVLFVAFVVATFAACVFVLPKRLACRIVLFGMRVFYRFHIHGQSNIPKEGGAVLVANHVSWLDGMLMLICNPRPVRMLVFAGNFQRGLMARAGQRWGVIMISAGPKAIVKAFKEARESLARGELVGIFPEGGITRSGMTQSFRPGLLKILKGNDVPVIPIYIDGLWGSIFSFERMRFFTKIPKHFRYPFDFHFGTPLRNVDDIHAVRQAVQQLGAKAVTERQMEATRLCDSVVRACKQRKFTAKIADSTGAELTGGSVLMRALILRRLLRKHVLGENETNVGVLLPPSNGAVITNLALTFDKRVAINLNYTVSSDVMNACVKKAGIRRVLTSQRVMEKLDLQIEAEIVYLEDLRAKLSKLDQITSALAAYVVPAGMLIQSLGFDREQPEDTQTVIFTSGSTGIPKGVMLTFANVRSNVDAINQVIHLEPRDGIVGVLPFFHSFGYTVTLWTVMASNIKGMYHFNPLDARQVGKLIKKNGGTILVATPTFLRGYMRRCSKEELATIDTVVAGAEKLPKDLCDSFEKKFGVRPIEGYGTTELSPLVSVNVPPSRSTDNHQVDAKEGTVGRPIPGVAAKVVDDDNNELPTNQSGMLLISGPNVMKGYLDEPEKTAEVIRDGWYVTGDVAEIDDDGFIKITGRQSRFSKIGGEMVPHLRIEESLQQIIGALENDDDAADDEGELKIAVTAVPDAKKGERLIVLHTQLRQSPAELTSELKAMGLPNLFIPGNDSFYQVESIPLLGTGKLDLKQLKDLALELTEA